jgi:site-specific DNA-methyltransferase (adenine-specific)
MADKVESAKKSKKNKTIDFPLDSQEGRELLELCKTASDVGGDPIDSIFCGDSFEICEKMPRGFVDLLIVDPPYNLSKNYHGTKFSKTDDEEYRSFTRKWLTAVIPLLKPTASVYVCCDWRSGMVISELLDEMLCLRQRITWQREKGRGAEKSWKNGMEDIWFATVSDDYNFNLDAVKLRRRVIAPYKTDGVPKDWQETPDGRFRDTCPSNFWDDISIPYWSMAENTAHPTQKPEKLLAKLILASSNEGDVVFDMFGGSGSTLIACEQRGVSCYMMELDPKYVDVIVKRWEAFTGEKAVLLNG